MFIVLVFPLSVSTLSSHKNIFIYPQRNLLTPDIDLNQSGDNIMDDRHAVSQSDINVEAFYISA